MNSQGRTHVGEIWFWQRIVSPHMAGLASSLAEQGMKVSYVAEQEMSEDRMHQGWVLPNLNDVRVELAPTAALTVKLAGLVPVDSIHICQGLRANGLVAMAQRALAARGLTQLVVMETLNGEGWRGHLRSLEYRRLFAKWQRQIAGILAIGYQTPEWIADRGMPMERVFPFAYFLPSDVTSLEQVRQRMGRYRFIFVGQLIERKRLDLLVSALNTLGRTDVELAVVGSGPLEAELRKAAEAALPGRVDWIGPLSQDEVPRAVADADCLVLPSQHDGWGAVASEALMVGTPVICSDHCGAAGVVRASGRGDVFSSGSVNELARALNREVERLRLTLDERGALAHWARCLGADVGATYLRAVLDYLEGRGSIPATPWSPRLLRP